MSSFGSVANKKELIMPSQALLAVFRKEYNPDQARDADGRFGAGGNATPMAATAGTGRTVSGDADHNARMRDTGFSQAEIDQDQTDRNSERASRGTPERAAADQAKADAINSDMSGTHSGSSPVADLAAGAAAKEETDNLAALNVVKAEEEHRYTLGLAYPAMKPDSARAADGYIDFVSSEVLEKTAWSWMEKNHEIGMFHRDGTEGHATVVESYIYRGPDWTVASPVNGQDYVIKAGDWLMGCQWDSHGWSMVKAGLVKGWSPEGGARRSKPSQSRLAELRS